MRWIPLWKEEKNDEKMSQKEWDECRSDLMSHLAGVEHRYWEHIRIRPSSCSNTQSREGRIE